MKSASETMVGVIVLAFMAILGTSYITASLNTQRAQNYHSAVVSEIEASNYANDVIQDCKEKAIENGYNALTIDKKTTLSGNSYAKVTLDYSYSIPILNMIGLEHEIVGYAR